MTKSTQLTKKEINRFLKKYINEGKVNEVTRLIEIIGRRLTSKEVDDLVKNCIEKQSILDAKKAIKLGHASKKTLDFLVKACLEKQEFKEAVEISLLGASIEMKVEALLYFILYIWDIFTTPETY